MKVGELFVTLGLRDRGFKAGIDGAQKSTSKLGHSLLDLTGLTGGFGSRAAQAGEELAGLAGASTAASSSIGLAVTAIGVATAGLGLLGKAALDAAGKSEQLRVAFTTMFRGDVSAARSMVTTLQDLADRTNYTMEQLAPAAQRLKAFGFGAGEVVPALVDIGDAVAAMGGTPDNMLRIVDALGRIRNQGRVTGEDLRILAENNINAYEYLATAMGTSIEGARDAISKGNVDAAKAVPAILAGMRQQFGGGMERQSATLLGIWSTLQDKVTGVFRTLGNLTMPGAKHMISWIITLTDKAKSLALYLQATGKALKWWLGNTGMGQAVSTLAKGFGSLVVSVLKFAGANLGVVGSALLIMLKALSPILGVVASLLGTAAKWISKILDLVTKGETAVYKWWNRLAGNNDTAKAVTANVRAMEERQKKQEALDKAALAAKAKADAAAHKAKTLSPEEQEAQKQELDGIKDYIAKQREAREETRKRRMDAIGFRSMESLWSSAMVMGQRNILAPPSPKDISPASLPATQELRAIREQLRDQKKAQDETNRLLRERSGVAAFAGV